MRSQKILLLMLVLVMPAGLFLFGKYCVIPAVSRSNIETSFNEPLVATFDRSYNPGKQIPTSIEHISIKLDKRRNPALFNDFSKILSLKANVMVTVKLMGDLDGSLLTDVTGGAFDDTFDLLFEVLNRHKQAVLVRLNPEMEVPVKTYPWQYQSSAAYVDAYRHFARMCKAATPQVRLVWGPAGYPGTEEYYPGDGFTDVISITLQSESEKLLNTYPPYPDLQTAVKRKLHRVRFMDKPVMILGNGKIDFSQIKGIEDGLSQVRSEKQTIYATASFKNRGKATARVSQTVIGVYDPKLSLTGSESVNAEHIFIDIAHVQDGSFEKDFNSIIERKHDVIVSFEPWRDQKVRKDTNVLSNTINGVYDPEIRELYRILKTTNQTVYLRFAHEMEIPIRRYAWQSQDPVLYIKAYRYFMNFERLDHNIRRVWGPAGDRGSMEWWPGEDVVDYISLAVYGLPDKNITDPKMQESFRTIYNRKFNRVYFAHKPIFVTEFGVKGPEDHKERWLTDAADLIKAHQEIAGISYFNFADNPKAWGNIPPPDWSITRTAFEKFAKKLSER